MTNQPNQANKMELQAQVLQLLNWTEEEYSAFIYETGMSYLKEYFGKDTAAIDLLCRRREFWNWFKTHWHYRDQSFFESFQLSQCSLPYRLTLYRNLHNAQILACDIYPSRQVLGPNFSSVKIQLC